MPKTENIFWMKRYTYFRGMDCSKESAGRDGLQQGVCAGWVAAKSLQGMGCSTESILGFAVSCSALYFGTPCISYLWVDPVPPGEAGGHQHGPPWEGQPHCRLVFRCISMIDPFTFPNPYFHSLTLILAFVNGVNRYRGLTSSATVM